MTGNIHRILMTIGGIAGGLGGLFALPENSALGVPNEAGALMAIIAGACIIIANTIRANWPDVQPETTKTTLEVKTGEGGTFDVGGGGILGLIALILIILCAVVFLWINIDVNEDPNAIMPLLR